MYIYDATIDEKVIRDIRKFEVLNNSRLLSSLEYDLQKYIREEAIVEEINLKSKNIVVKSKEDNKILGFYTLKFHESIFFPNKNGEEITAIEICNIAKNLVYSSLLKDNNIDFTKIFAELILPKLVLAAKIGSAKIAYVNTPIIYNLVQVFSRNGFNVLEDDKTRKLVHKENGFKKNTIMMYRAL